MIRNLIFDLGGVIMDIRRTDCVSAFEELGMQGANEFFGEYKQSGPFLRLEAGEIGEDEFRAAMRRLITVPVTDAELDAALNRFLVGIPVHRLRELEELHRRYGMYLLSNTNPIMWRSRIADQFRKDGHDVNYYFDGMVTSFAARSVKPARGIFDTLVADCGIDPAESLFLDDSQANVDAARALGFHAVVVEPGDEFNTLIERYLHEHNS